MTALIKGHDTHNIWRGRVGIEPTQDAHAPNTGFEDQEAHQLPNHPHKKGTGNYVIIFTRCQTKGGRYRPLFGTSGARFAVFFISEKSSAECPRIAGPLAGSDLASQFVRKHPQEKRRFAESAGQIYRSISIP